MSKFVGESEKGVRETFKRAKQTAPCIIFFDEIDALAPRRGTGITDSHVSERVISQLLTEIDGLEELRGVVVLAATNRTDLIDPALLRAGRFDQMLYIPPPDQEARLEIFRIHTKKNPLVKNVSLQKLAAETDGYMGSDIEAVCREATMLAIRKYINRHEERETGEKSPKLQVTMEDFEQAIKRIKEYQRNKSETEETII
jgi:transitional endoplasmic reticulum ATPase